MRRSARSERYRPRRPRRGRRLGVIVNTNGGFDIVGTDFVVTAHLTDKLTYQDEVNCEVARGETSEIEAEAERFHLDYVLNE